MAKLGWVIVFVSLFGLIAASYALSHHYADPGTSFCNLDERFNCDLVNKSAYSEVMGVPVALIGMLGYVAIALAALTMLGVIPDWFQLGVSWRWLFPTIVGGGFFFSAYLTWLEFARIKAYCVICLSSQASILALFVLSLIWVRNWKTKSLRT